MTLRLPVEADAAAIVAFYRSNREHLRLTELVRPRDFYAVKSWRQRIVEVQAAFAGDRAVRLILSPHDAASDVIGLCNFNHIVRGAYQACVLGYALDRQWQAKGLMSEALRTGIDFIFGPMGLHRVMANYMPQNERSARLLRRLGFVYEGFARNYLYINGVWEDHILTALHNGRWRAATG